VAAHYAAAALFDNFEDEARIYCYDVAREDFGIERSGRARAAAGTITVRSAITREESRFDFAVLHLGETELTGGIRAARANFAGVKTQLLDALEPGGIPAIIRLLDQHFNETPISIRSLFRDAQRRIFHLLCNETLEEAESAFRQLHSRYDPLMRFHTRLGIPVPKVLQTAAEFDLNVQVRRLVEDENPPLAELDALLREAREERVALDETTRMAVEQAIDRAAVRFTERPEDLDRLEMFAALVSIVRAAQLEVGLRRPQNAYYQMMAMVRPAIAENRNGSREVDRWLELFDALGDKLSISRRSAHSE
jgi:hypothetical protein